MNKAIQSILAYLQSKHIPCRAIGNYIAVGVSMQDFAEYSADPFEMPQTQGFSHEWETSLRIEVMAD